MRKRFVFDFSDIPMMTKFLRNVSNLERIYLRSDIYFFVLLFSHQSLFSFSNSLSLSLVFFLTHSYCNFASSLVLLLPLLPLSAIVNSSQVST